MRPPPIIKNDLLKKINDALAEKFGKGKIRLKRSKNPERPLNLWFKKSHPNKETIQAAEKIVGKFMDVKWYEDEAIHT
jgi:hypothetical protein